ncbi:MAG: hypothetical protein CMD81_10425 [Gammaproteobacteria bacterium]|nr:hypothetical protein [Gammaproteobacteria bacterium]HBF09507.1 hypothetical protein [Gammaproteobacteria bacterium]|tara:strand:+ start:287 stop:1507 length:1221 start_codon:yes stop_codon:yes gene_type:complete
MAYRKQGGAVFPFKPKSILSKLVLMNFCIVILLIITIVAINYAMSKKMINNFVQTNEQMILQDISRNLAVYYEISQSWDNLKSKKKWRFFVEENIDLLPGEPPLMPAPHLFHKKHLKKNKSAFIDPLKRIPEDIFNYIFSRLRLVDTSNKIIAGGKKVSVDSYFQEIDVDGKNVGRLYLKKSEKKTNEMVHYYLESQYKPLLLITLMGLVIAFIVSFIFSKIIIHPISLFRKSMKRLADRDFQTKLVITTSDEFESLAEDFNSVSSSLSRFQEQQKQWLMDISHELRTPVTILRGEIEALADGINQCTPEYVGIMKTNIVRLNTLLNDLYEVSVTDDLDLKLFLSNTNLKKMIVSIVNRMHIQFSERNISIELCLEDCDIFLDYRRIEQVFLNILSNNVKYTHTAA